MRIDLRFSLALAGWLAACFVGSVGASACSHHTPPPVEPEPPASAIPAPGPPGAQGTAANEPAGPSLVEADRASKLGTGPSSSSGPLKVQSLDAPNDKPPSTGPSYVDRTGVVTPPTPSVMNSGGKSTPPPPAPLGK